MEIDPSIDRYLETSIKVPLTAGEHEVSFVFKNISDTTAVQVRELYLNRSGFDLSRLDTDRDGMISERDVSAFEDIVSKYDIKHDDNRVDIEDP